MLNKSKIIGDLSIILMGFTIYDFIFKDLGPSVITNPDPTQYQTASALTSLMFSSFLIFFIVLAFHEISDYQKLLVDFENSEDKRKFREDHKHKLRNIIVILGLAGVSIYLAYILFGIRHAYSISISYIFAWLSVSIELHELRKQP